MLFRAHEQYSRSLDTAQDEYERIKHEAHKIKSQGKLCNAFVPAICLRS